MTTTNRYTELLEPFKHLWKTDDKEGLKERREQWNYIAANNFRKEESVSYKKLCGKYFIYGTKGEEYLDLLYFLTPINSPETAKQLFDSDLFDFSMKRDLADRYLVIATIYGKGSPWLRQHIQYFVEGVLGKEYKVVKIFEETMDKIVSPDPSVLSKMFVSWGGKVLSGKFDYHGFVECVDYAVSTLAHADDPEFRKQIKLKQLLTLVDDVLAQDNPPEIALEFAQKLKAKEQEIKDNWAVHAHLDVD